MIRSRSFSFLTYRHDLTAFIFTPDSRIIGGDGLYSPRARNGETFQRSPCLFDGHSLMNARCVLVFLVQILLAVSSRAQVVINEIFYDAPDDLTDLQWVELY